MKIETTTTAELKNVLDKNIGKYAEIYKAISLMRGGEVLKITFNSSKEAATAYASMMQSRAHGYDRAKKSKFHKRDSVLYIEAAK